MVQLKNIYINVVVIVLISMQMGPWHSAQSLESNSIKDLKIKSQLSFSASNGTSNKTYQGIHVGWWPHSFWAQTQSPSSSANLIVPTNDPISRALHLNRFWRMGPFLLASLQNKLSHFKLLITEMTWNIRSHCFTFL